MGSYTTTDNSKQDAGLLPVGVNSGIDAEQYHRTLGLTKSGLMALRKSPAHFWQWMTSPPDPSTQSMMLGTATHTLVFEPEKWDKEIVVIPDDAPKKPTMAQVNAKKPSAEGQASIKWWNKFYEENKDKTTITQEQYVRAKGMADAVMACEEITPYLKHSTAQAELSIVGNEIVNGMSIACKGRCDLITMNGTVILDLKTTQDSSSEKFSKNFMSLGYWMQAAHYMKVARLAGLPIERFIFIAVESEAPYSVALYELDDESLRKAFEIRQKLLERLANCIASGKYPSHSKGINKLKMPWWME